jgi:hypothetical protein
MLDTPLRTEHSTPQSSTSFKESCSHIVVRVFHRIDPPREGCSTGRRYKAVSFANPCVFKQLELVHLGIEPEQSGRQIATLPVCLTQSLVTLMAVAHSDVGAEVSQ